VAALTWSAPQVWNDARLAWCACVTLRIRCIQDLRWGVIEGEEQESASFLQSSLSEAATAAAQYPATSAFTSTALLSLISPCLPPTADAALTCSLPFDLEFPTG
jgi:hypothetical protein